jgi:hypothetical protein
MGREKIAKLNVMPKTGVIVAYVEDNLFTQQKVPIFFVLLPEAEFTIQKVPSLTARYTLFLYPPFSWFPGHTLFQRKSSLETDHGFVHSEVASRFIMNTKLFSPCPVHAHVVQEVTVVICWPWPNFLII